MAECEGIVQFYKKGKGFGFIREKGGKSRRDDIFVHHSDVIKAGLSKLKPDQKVGYDIGPYVRKLKVNNEEETTEESFKAVNLVLIN